MGKLGPRAYQEMPSASTTTTPETFESTDQDIRVVDDFLPPTGYDELAELIANEPLAYGSRSNLRTDPPLRIAEAPQPGAGVGFIAVWPEGAETFVIRPRSLFDAVNR